MADEMKAVAKMYDVLKWLLPQVSKLPRSHKFTLGDRITDLGLDVLGLLIEASYTRRKLDLLCQANIRLEQMRYLLRLCRDLDLLSLKRYGYISREINEAGSLVGGWIKQQRGNAR
ncbi:diversity-generating retroelement protein Avd [Candidatus Poribacteria bacterium]|nr:diversity-generating retroelement protein Avd [Candidatus Poribacteria bacterium]